MTRRLIDVVLDALERGEQPVVVFANDPAVTALRRAIAANHPSAQHLTAADTKGDQ